ncbi:hypothetical protein HHI36_015988 [Cryptolaemus montrouzieri]|uniref:Uncharacterized protein n=1 Tax=Cryptolaemus montrouzieri TaxID=559131 RepID=A0ABD2N7A8_9CUCU
MKYARVKIGEQNVIKQLPAVMGLEKSLKSPLDILLRFFDQQIFTARVHFTNKNTEARSGIYATERDAHERDIVEMMALLRQA